MQGNFVTRPFILDPLFQSTKAVAGVGPRTVKLLERLGAAKIADLLWHLPVALVDRRYAPKIADAEVEKIATLTVMVDEHKPAKKRGTPYRVRCHDETGVLHLVFFNPREDWITHQLPVGETRIVSGRLEIYNKVLQMPHPDTIAPVHERAQIEVVEPVYPLTAGLTNKIVTKIIRAALARTPDLPEWQNLSFIKQQGWPAWADALRCAHAPKSNDDLFPLHPARQRLAYDELLANQLTIALVRQQQKTAKGRALLGNAAAEARALAALPFTLTGSQRRAVDDIARDMKDDQRMLRLLQGEDRKSVV